MEGILVDVFLKNEKIFVWIRQNKKNLFFEVDFLVKFFVGGNKKELQKVSIELSKNFSETEYCAFISKEKELESNKKISVLKVVVKNFRKRNLLVRFIESKFEYSLQLYNADIPIEHLYLFEKNLRPLGQVEFEAENGKIISLKPKTFENFTENFIDFKISYLEVFSRQGRQFDEEIDYIRFNDKFFRGKEEELLRDFKANYGTFDPDIVITNSGSKFDLNYIKFRMKKNRIGFSFGRHQDSFSKSSGKTFFSYGRVVRKEPAHYFKGRLHIEKNSFHFKECKLHGVLEIAYSTTMPIQKVSQKGSGTCLSNLQLFEAFRMGILVPMKKNQVERFGSGWKLFEIDKGGLVFEPLIGLHENVVELDFSSLYPSIMVHHNISPETLFCDCCKENVVPEAGFNICKKKKGFIPRVLKPLLSRRLYFKKLKKITFGEEKKSFEEKCTALKWLLVVSFGYTGYKNARFGRIEAHQAICAYAREILIKTVNVCEENDFEIVHAIIDAVYIKKKNYLVQEIEQIIKKVNAQTSMELLVEGVFKWVVFLPSVKNSKISAITRYFGAYINGDYKIRGMHLRRRDTPFAIKKMQEEQILVFGKANNADEFNEKIPLAISKMREWIAKLNNDLIPVQHLKIKKAVSKKLEEYKANCAQKAVLIQLKQKGKEVFPGESINFIYTNSNSPKYLNRVSAFEKNLKIDKEKYKELFINATHEMLSFSGLSKKKLELFFEQKKQKKLIDFASEKSVRLISHENIQRKIFRTLKISHQKHF